MSRIQESLKAHDPQFEREQPKSISKRRRNLFWVFLIGGVVFGVVGGIVYNQIYKPATSDIRDKVYIISVIIGLVVGALIGGGIWTYYTLREQSKSEEIIKHRIQKLKEGYDDLDKYYKGRMARHKHRVAKQKLYAGAE